MSRYFILSDIHIDFYCSYESQKTYNDYVKEFESVYNVYFNKNAENLIIAGDICNIHTMGCYFLDFISTKYEKVYLVFGNHDLLVKHNSTVPFSKSSERIKYIKSYIKDFKNVHLLDGNVVDGIGGCMGMCDFSYKPVSNIDYYTLWRTRWFDGIMWNHTNQDQPHKIWKYYEQKMHKVLDKNPKVFITHFIPIQMGMAEKYKNSCSSCFFYMDGEQFLDRMGDDTYWICGHTHSSWKTDYVNKNGNTIHILCNPLGYPYESTYKVKEIKDMQKKFTVNI